MAIGLIIVGDEILSGRRADAHLPKVVAMLRERGLQLDWAEIVGDDPARIVATLERTFASGDIVFSCGGIGATPDDHTRQCAAQALQVPLALHPEATTLIRQRIAEMAAAAGQPCDLDSAENLHRLKMASSRRAPRSFPIPTTRCPASRSATIISCRAFP
jgi:molybdopterin-biosynthesis enzyme MoeA-like protein